MRLLPRVRRGRAGAARCRPFVEPLEDRCVPAVPVTGAVETNPGTQVADAQSGPTTTGPDSSQVTQSGDTAALAENQNNADLLLGTGSAPPVAPATAGLPPAELGLATADGLLSDAVAPDAQRASLSPFLTTVPPAFVSNFGPQVEDGVVVQPAVPDQASIGFPGRVVLPGTEVDQRANLAFGPFEQELTAAPRVVASPELPPPREDGAAGVRPAADGEADAAAVTWLDLTLIPSGLPEVSPPPAPPEGPEAPDEHE